MWPASGCASFMNATTRGPEPAPAGGPGLPVLHGLKSCDTVKRARAWLAAQGVAHGFHDLRAQGLPEAVLGAALDSLGAGRLLNRQGSTWRRLDEAARARAAEAEGLRALLREHPSLIRRPLVHWPDGRWTVGFDAGDWAARLGR